MCEICRQTRCSSRCPNAQELKPTAVCLRCKEGIYEGAEYFDSPDGSICKECMEDMDYLEILEIIGEEMKVVEVA